MGNESDDHSLAWTLTLSLLAVLAAGALLLWLMWDVEALLVGDALTNVSTAGGIVAGLSLSGTAVLTLNGRFTVRLLERYGPAIRFVLFGGFSTLISISLICGLAVLWRDTMAAKVILSFGAPAMFAILLATALLINSAFAHEQRAPRPKKKSPLSQLRNDQAPQ